MPKICYTAKKFSPGTWEIIDLANQIIADYDAQGFSLTLRQLYYQFVARDLLPNKQSEYKRLGSIVNNARMAGEIDWNSLEDRTRFRRANQHWEDPAQIVRATARSYRLDLWEGQQYRPEVWIEKDALVGVIEDVCTELDVPYFACRGYNSQSNQWRAGRRFEAYDNVGLTPYVIHLGDHDPSGMDMTRDNDDRLNLFADNVVTVERIALNFYQVEQYNPPPNPAKETDSRSSGYVREFGRSSWELDALEPAVIVGLVREAVENLIDFEERESVIERQEEERKALTSMARNWSAVTDFLETLE